MRLALSQFIQGEETSCLGNLWRIDKELSILRILVGRKALDWTVVTAGCMCIVQVRFLDIRAAPS